MGGRVARTLSASCTALLVGAVVVQARPVDVQAQTLEQLSTLSLEELANIEVTSISKRPEPLSQAAAAVFVITAEDIRRTGATSLPEALRLAPNLEVARLNAYNYSVTARGFNSQESANKLLVLVDGRSVYSPFAATVFWESVDVPLADVERIEVISGPGGTLWGANAVNGVINVITRHSRDTQGFLVDAHAGNRDSGGTVRYGGRFGETGSYRLYASGFDRPNTEPLRSSDRSKDAFRGSQAGFRIDGASEGGRDSYTLQGDTYRNLTAFLDMTLEGGNLLGRWTRQLGDGSSVSLQAYYDRKDREYLLADDELTTWDIQAQHNFKLGDRHQIVWGGEYRLWHSDFTTPGLFAYADPSETLSVANLFVQDEFALRPDLKLTVGLKAERNSYTGFEFLPNARLAWQLDDSTLLWGAVSRAVRTPSRVDRELSAPGILVEASDFRSEELTAFEIGYRGQPTARTTLSVSAFYNIYDHLRTTGRAGGTALPLRFRNDLQGETWGVESWGSLRVNDWWTLKAGGNWLRKNLELESGAIDASNLQAAGDDPEYQAQLRSEMMLAPGVWLDFMLRRVGHVTPSDVPAYTELDAHIGWQVTPALEFSLHGQNLLDQRHLETINPSTSSERYIGRSVYGRLRAVF
nr:TonB-dependent receptor [Azospirillum sp. SYSU D00513]